MFGVLSWLVVLLGSAQCRQGPGPASSQTATTLRVGVGGLSVQAAEAGMKQVVANLSLEGLVNFNEDGRPRAFLAESWVTSPDGLTLTLQLHKQARFHDGTPVTASAVIGILQRNPSEAHGRFVRGCCGSAGPRRLADSVPPATPGPPVDRGARNDHPEAREGRGKCRAIRSHVESAGTHGKPRLLPGQAGHRQDPVYALPDGARRVGGAAAR